MRKVTLLAAAAAAAAALTALPAAAHASVIVDGTPYGLGSSFTIFFNGFAGGPVIPGLTSNIVFTVNSFSSTQYVLGFDIHNTTSSPMTASRVSEFGFNTDPNITNATATGILGNIDTNGNVPNFGTVEVCDSGGGSCAGGGGGGVTMGDHGTGTITLNFSSIGNLVLNNFEVRYQSMAGPGIVAGRNDSATGAQVPGVPEPATWAMMVVGFGAAGAAMRRNRRRKPMFAQVA